MHTRSLMFLAAGNMAAALYHERKAIRRLYVRMEGSVEAKPSYDPEAIGYINSSADMEPLRTFIPNMEKRDRITRWLMDASDADLSTCKVGIATYGNMVCWSFRTTIHRDKDGVTFSGRFGNLTTGQRFAKTILRMSNGDEIARQTMSHPIEVLDGVVGISASYRVRFV